jgi:hypothetical protein
MSPAEPRACLLVTQGPSQLSRAPLFDYGWFATTPRLVPELARVRSAHQKVRQLHLHILL